MHIKTNIGNIMITKSGYTDEGYPGFVFSVGRDGAITDLALLEVDETEDEPVLKIHVWGPGHEDPVFDQYLNATQIDRMNKEGK